MFRHQSACPQDPVSIGMPIERGNLEAIVDQGVDAEGEGRKRVL